MKKILIFAIIFLLILVAIAIVIIKTPYSPQFTIEDLTESQIKYVAHAGGALYINGEKYTYTNSYDAIKQSYDSGIRLCELDFLYTVDGKAVSFHTWDGFLTKFFNVESKDTYTHDEFMNFTMINGWEQLDLKSVIKYMKHDFPELILITDIKDDNIKLLTEISSNYSNMMDRIIPQVYNQDEYYKAKNLGFKHIIYTLYQSEDTDKEVIEFCQNNSLFAITMPKARVTKDLAESIVATGTKVYAHTVDDKADEDYLISLGVTGIYTNETHRNNNFEQ